MGDICRLGQPRRARCIDIQRPCIYRRQRSLIHRKRDPLQMRELCLHRTKVVVASANCPALQIRRQARARGGQPVGEVGTRDHQARCHDVDAMGERVSKKMRVDQRNRHANTGE